MSISTTKHHNISLSERQQQEIITNEFELFGETFEFAEIFSATVISSNPTNAQILVKTNDGDEKQISAYGIAVRNWICPLISRQGLYLKLTLPADVDILAESDNPTHCADGFHCNARSPLQDYAMPFLHSVSA